MILTQFPPPLICNRLQRADLAQLVLPDHRRRDRLPPVGSGPAPRSLARLLLRALGPGNEEYERSTHSSSSHGGHGDEDDDGEVDNRPFLTRYMAYYTTPTEEYKRRNLKHLALARDAAEDKLFFQEAERPPIQRFRYTG